MTSGSLLVQPFCSSRATQNKLLRSVQMAFGYLQGGRLHILPGQHIPVFGHTCSKMKAFLMFRPSLLCFSFCPVPLPFHTRNCTGLVWAWAVNFEVENSRLPAWPQADLVAHCQKLAPTYKLLQDCKLELHNVICCIQIQATIIRSRQMSLSSFLIQLACF